MPVYLSVINLGGALSTTERGRGLVAARFPISCADAFAVVAARDRGGVVMTGDPEFGPLADAGLVAVEWLPRRRT